MHSLLNRCYEGIGDKYELLIRGFQLYSEYHYQTYEGKLWGNNLPTINLGNIRLEKGSPMTLTLRGVA